MTETRVPAGVPTGGQFATSVRAESAVDLADRPTPLGLATLAADQVTAVTGKFRDVLTVAAEAERIRREYPSARYVALRTVETREYDADDDRALDVVVHNEHHDEIDIYRSEAAPLNYPVRADLADEPWGYTWSAWDEEDDVVFVDLDAASRIDLDAESARYREAVATALAD